ncbi:MAG TPA: macro domain-containing protein [Rhodothermales bacterium]|nr:macro domain-containing protein [Rhodothermales bacterium]
MPFPLELWLIHPEPEACEAFHQRFEGLPDVRVLPARFEELGPHDCFVTAGNAFGIMTAGIDAAVVAVHGPALMERVQRRIVGEYLGEQPVGSCFIESTGTPAYPYVAHAPTMRMPGPIDGTDAVYRAAWAALLAVYRHNGAARRGGTGEREIHTLAMPALGTGFGGVGYSESARQMAAAYRYYLHPPHRLDWDVAVARHKGISFDGGTRVVR